MRSFEYKMPISLQEAQELLSQYGEEAKLIAGGTALILLMKQQLVQPAYLISLRKVAGLDSINFNGGGLHVGALCTHRSVETSPLVREKAPILAETYKHVATVRVRNMATVGGGLCHGDPNQDSPTTLISLNAKVVLASPGGRRVVPLDEFFLDYYETATRPDEILTEVMVPPIGSRTGTAFIKYLPRTADDYATVSVAVALTPGDDNRTCREVRVVLGSAGSTPVRAKGAESVLRGQELSLESIREAAATVREDVDPVSDARGSSDYKREMAVVFARRALERALRDAQGRAARASG